MHCEEPFKPNEHQIARILDAEQARDFFPQATKLVEPLARVSLDDMQVALTKTGVMTTPEVVRAFRNELVTKGIFVLEEQPLKLEHSEKDAIWYVRKQAA